MTPKHNQSLSWSLRHVNPFVLFYLLAVDAVLSKLLLIAGQAVVVGILLHEAPGANGLLATVAGETVLMPTVALMLHLFRAWWVEGAEREREKRRVGETQHLQLTMFSLCFYMPEFSHELNKNSYSRSHYTSGIQISLRQLQLMAMSWFLLMACWQLLTKVIKSTVVPTD